MQILLTTLITSTRNILSYHKDLSIIHFSVSLSLLLWSFPSLLQSDPTYSLTSIKWSPTIAVVSRNYFSRVPAECSSPYPPLPLSWCCPWNGRGSHTTPTATSCLCVLHGVDSPLKSCHIYGTLHEVSLINKKQISLVLYSVTVVPKEHCLGIPKSLRLNGKGDFSLFPIIPFSLGLRHESLWIGQKGDQVLETIVLNSVLKLLFPFWADVKHLAQNLAHSKCLMKITCCYYLTKLSPLVIYIP